MSFNPVRAANFTRRAAPRVYDPKAGTKHSDIIRRQGVGFTVPMLGRENTATGIAVTLTANDKFVVRSEVIGKGNNLGLVVNDTQDRLLLLRAGSVFVQVHADGDSKSHRLQVGSHINIPKGLAHLIASSGTEEAELLFVEEPGYAQNCKILTQPETQGLSAVLAGNVPVVSVDPVRRTDQTVVKAQALSSAKERARRQPGRVVDAAGVAKPVGSVRAPVDSAQVIGVNPRPLGAAAFSADD